MPKSYLPQFLYMAKRLSVYFAKHQTTLFRYVSDPTHQAAMTQCIADLNHCLSLFNRPPEQP